MNFFPSSRPQNHQEENKIFLHLKILIIFFLSSIFLSLIFPPTLRLSGLSFRLSHPSPVDVVSPIDAKVVDEEATNEKIREMKAKSFAFYRINYRLNEDLKRNLENLLRERNEEKIKREISRLAGKDLIFPPGEFLKNFLRFSHFVSTRSKSFYIYDRSDESLGRVVLLDEEGRERKVRKGSILSREEFIRLLFRKYSHTFHIPLEEENKVIEILSSILHPNCFLDEKATEEFLNKMLSDSIPVTYSVKKGEVITRKGEILTRESLLKIRKIIEVEKREKKIPNFFLRCFFFTLLMFFSFTLTYLIYKEKSSVKDSAFAGLFVIFHSILLKIFLDLSYSLSEGDMKTLLFLTPYIYLILIPRSLIRKSHLALFFNIVFPFFLFLFPIRMKEVLSLYWLFTGTFVLLIYADIKMRFDMVKYTLLAGILSSPLSFLLYYFYESKFSIDALSYSFLSCLLSGIMGIGLLPVVERIFSYTSNVNLLELASLNHPLLKELALKAPGTYNHSIMVGTLAEGAAESIGANPILIRVAAYFHDIGKMKKPVYYIENQKEGVINPHVRYTPSMSALVIMSHVREGIEMAKRYHLPEEIINVIREHQGTSLLSLFYEKARERAEDPSEVKEEDFRYPGPKPRTKESAIIMLADTVEAASRTLKSATPDQIAGMVQKLINRLFTDGQLEESPLTLKDLHLIAGSFIKTLESVYHRRIDYPKPVIKGKIGEGANGEGKQTKGEYDEQAEKSDVEQIKRLGTPRG